jgi:DNA-binding LacI/PurR family transcriptional regulator/signal transduction histidine kinase/ActR/RegA family two-component response regulator
MSQTSRHSTPPIPSHTQSRAPGLLPPAARRRRTIAVLLDYMTLHSGAYECEIRNAFDAVCRRLDLDLLLVYGTGVDEQDGALAAHNSIYNLLGPESVDGIVALTSSIATYCGSERMTAFLEQYGRIPVCSLGVKLKGVPSVLVDHRAGMLALLEHIVGDHGHRRVAFIAGTAGHPDAEVRFDAYREVLDRHAIPFDGALVANGGFTKGIACIAMREILSRGVTFDAVVAANDLMAIGAMEVLRENGIRIPRDVAVTGFDDTISARLGSPPMTTVAQPFAAMAEHAIELLMLQAQGREVPLRCTLPSEFILRDSCGCTARANRKEFRSRLHFGTDVRSTLRRRGQAIRSALSQVLVSSGTDGPGDSARLIDALEQALDGHPEVFLDALETVLERSGGTQEHGYVLQQGITCLREHLCPGSALELEDLWHDARELVALFGSRGEVRRRNDIDDSYYRTLIFGQQVSSALDLSSLKCLLEKILPASGIRTAWLSLFASDTSAELEPLIALVNATSVDPMPARFGARLLVPPSTRESEQHQTLLVFPMVCDTQILGVAAFEYDPNVQGYPLIRDQISAAVRTINLHHDLVTETMLRERSVQERAATTKRMQSLSVLAGGVAHDLNNVLGPLVGLPGVMLAELDQFDGEPENTTELRADLDTMRTAALRASQTIRDLLTLSRQGRTVKERLDLNRAVLNCMGNDSLRDIREAYPGVHIVCDTASEPLVLCGSEAHVGRAVANLVRNAVEAVASRGEVRIKTFGVHLEQPTFGFETVKAGDYAVVNITDNGVGIPMHEIAWIFEPFTSKKRVNNTSGTGLGLAIVHGVAKEHEGFVDVTSSVGSGTTFTLYFPRVQESIQSAETGELRHGSARILVLDDEPVQLRTARRLLKHLGYTVETVSTGHAAISLFAEASVKGQDPFDLVLLDMMLNGEMDGLQVFDEIRRWFPKQRAIIVSGHAPNERVERALAEGLGWLGKPYTGESLANAVEEALLQHDDETRRRSSGKIKCLSPSSLPP